MTKSIPFKIMAAILNTAAFGYLGWMLFDAVSTGNLFLNNDESYTLEGIIILAPFALTILWSLIRRRKTWLAGLLTILVCTMANAFIGEDTTPSHVPLFVACVAVPYLFCMLAILLEKREKTATSSYESYANVEPALSADANTPLTDYSYASSDSYTDSTLSSEDKWKYINQNCHGMFSYSGMQTIDNDPNLTPAQKEDLKTYLKIYGD